MALFTFCRWEDRCKSNHFFKVTELVTKVFGTWLQVLTKQRKFLKHLWCARCCSGGWVSSGDCQAQSAPWLCYQCPGSPSKSGTCGLHPSALLPQGPCQNALCLEFVGSLLTSGFLCLCLNGLCGLTGVWGWAGKADERTADIVG